MSPFAAARTFRRSDTYTCTSFVAVGGGRPPQSSSTSRSLETTSFAHRSRTPSSARSFAGPNAMGTPSAAASSGPKIRNSMQRFYRLAYRPSTAAQPARCMLGGVIGRTRVRRLGRIGTSSAVLVAVTACAAATVGWAPAPRTLVRAAPSIRIDDVRPLRTPDEALRDLITHTFAVRVQISGWTLLPYQPGATARDNRRGAGHWRLY